MLMAENLLMMRRRRRANAGELAGVLLGSESNGLALVADDITLAIRDTTTPSNVFLGNANSKLNYASPSTKYILNQAGIYVPDTTLRCEYDASGNPLGIRIESQDRTNVVRHNRDLTNAVWTKTNATAAKDQTGIDGVANSASSLAATAGNATCLQAITLSSSARYQSAFIKRISGTGVIQMTMDNGATWTNVTVTASWSPVEIPAQTLANPTVGFRIVTSGDAIAVDAVGNENSTFRSSPIMTAGSTVTRAADNLSIATGLFPVGSDISAFIDATLINGTAGTQFNFGSTSSGDTLGIYASGGSLAAFMYDNYATQALLTLGIVSAGTRYKAAFRSSANNFAACRDAGAVATDAAGTAPTPHTSLHFGGNDFGGSFGFYHLRSFKTVPRAWSNAELQAVAA